MKDMNYERKNIELKICAKCKQEKILNESKKYRKDHKKEKAKTNKQYRLNNLDKIKKYKILNRDKIKKQRKEYYEKNKEKELKRNNEYYKKRKKSDINYRILTNIRTRIAKILSCQRTGKTESTKELLGCDGDFLKEWIKSQFDKNMSWDNYGSYWHIDHILPCSKFDLSNSEEREICFHYTNMRPLEKEENNRKKAKIL